MDPSKEWAVDVLKQAIEAARVNSSEGGPTFSGVQPSQQPPDLWRPATADNALLSPQMYSPYHLTLGSGLLGPFIGMGIERTLGNMGYTYMPTGVNPADVLRGRAYERGMLDTASVGQTVDERRLAQAIVGSLRNLYGDRPGTEAYANAMARTAAPALSAFGLMDMLPGGSAEDFAKHMYIAGQALRDYTQDRYAQRGEFKLGLPTATTQNLVQRLTDIFSPNGRADPRAMSGMSYGELGALAGHLTGYGLLGSDVSLSDIKTGARELYGADYTQLSNAKVKQLKETLRAANIATQLRDYAEIIKSMREIMGDDSAPLNQVIAGLQKLTGGHVQRYAPGQLANMIIDTQSVARAAGISTSAMVEFTGAGALQYQQEGGSGTLGGKVAQIAAASTAASQGLVTGPFEGRMDPTTEANVRFATITRGVRSSAMRVSSNALIMLEAMDTGRFSDEQKDTYSEIRATANELGWSDRNIRELQEKLMVLGVASSRSWGGLSRPVNEEYIEDHPELISMVNRRQVDAVTQKMVTVAQDAYDAWAAQGDNLAGKINAASAGAGGNKALMKAFGEAYTHVDKWDPENVVRHLKTLGFSVTKDFAREVMDALDSNEDIRYQLTRFGGDLDGRPEAVVQQFSYPRLKAAENVLYQSNSLAAGRRILNDLDVRYESTNAGTRLIAALSDMTAPGDLKLDGGKILKNAFIKTLGFEPNSEFMREFDTAAIGEYVQNQAKLNEESSKAIPDRHKIAQLKENQRAIAEAVVNIMNTAPGIEQTRGLVKMRDAIGEIGPGSSYERIASGTASVEDYKIMAERVRDWTPELIQAATKHMAPEDRREALNIIQDMQQAGENVLAEISYHQDLPAVSFSSGAMMKGVRYAGRPLEGMGNLWYAFDRAVYRTEQKGKRHGFLSRLAAVNELENALIVFGSLPKDGGDHRAAFARVQRATAGLKATGVITVDKDGRRMVNAEFVRELVLRHKKAVGPIAEALETNVADFIVSALGIRYQDVSPASLSEAELRIAGAEVREIPLPSVGGPGAYSPPLDESTSFLQRAHSGATGESSKTLDRFIREAVTSVNVILKDKPGTDQDAFRDLYDKLKSRWIDRRTGQINTEKLDHDITKLINDGYPRSAKILKELFHQITSGGELDNAAIEAARKLMNTPPPVNTAPPEATDKPGEQAHPGEPNKSDNDTVEKKVTIHIQDQKGNEITSMTVVVNTDQPAAGPATLDATTGDR